MFPSTLKLLFLHATALLVAHHYHPSPSTSAVILSSVTLERTNSFALIFSTLQCFSKTDEATTKVIELNANFNPEAHLDEYENPKDVKLLLYYVNRTRGPGQPRNDDPFTNAPEHISQLNLILNVLYANTENWPLFYNTSVWMVDRVNSAQLFWSLMIIAGEKYPDTVVTSSAVEVFPQLFINKREVAKVAGMELPEGNEPQHPLHYFTGDPGLNEFHTHWHIDNPFWWNNTREGVRRDRRGELFLYMHHQIVTRYQAELLSNGLTDIAPLELDPDYQFPEEYYPDIVNVNYRSFPPRRKGERMRDFDDGTLKTLKQLKTWYDRLDNGIEQGYFMKKDGSQESLQFDNGTQILGSTVEASAVYSANVEYYGSFHNQLHRFLGGMSKPNTSIPGVEAHSETAMRDPVFYRLHSLIDTLYLKLKQKATPYSRSDLEYVGVQIKSVEIQASRQTSRIRWYPSPQPPVLSTYFTWDKKWDISTAARPCRGVGEQPAFAKVKTLNHVPFNYVISVKSTKNSIGYGMLRIFLLPETSQDGRKLDVEESHQRAIELDRFRIKLEPNKEITLTRSSMNSSITREETPPGIKTLYKLKSTSGDENQLLRPKMTRACGYPHNLLIPKGTKDGLRFKLTVMLSEEPEPEGKEYLNFPYCGALNGVPYPDARRMGYPFDRQGTRFVSYEGIWAFLGGYAYKNVKQLPVVIQHQDN